MDGNLYAYAYTLYAVGDRRVGVLVLPSIHIEFGMAVLSPLAGFDLLLFVNLFLQPMRAPAACLLDCACLCATAHYITST